MQIRIARVLVAAVVTTLAAAPAAAQSIFASSGFNDAIGLNANASPGSPYAIGQTVANRGVGEAGWGGTWFVQDGGAQGGDAWAIVRAAAALEGDGGLELTPAPRGSTRPIRRLATPLGRQFVVEQDINFGAVGSVLSGPFQSMVSEGDRVGPMWSTGGPVGNRTFLVFDGNSNQLGEWEDTGIEQKPGQWQHVVMTVDVTTQRFILAVDGVQYNSPDPLGFFNAAAVIDHVDYMATGTGYIDNVVVRAVPEPAAAGMLMALGAVALRRRRDAGR